MKAIKSVQLGQAKLVEDVPVPSLEGLDEFVIVKTEYVALNSFDGMFIEMPMCFMENNTVGCDFCGTVVAAGAAVTRFKVGDRIAGCCFPANLLAPNGGCFAEYAIVKGDAQLKIDDQVSPAEAAALGVALCTSFYALYHLMRLPLPGRPENSTPSNSDDPKKIILINGGSSATGMIAIQLAKLSGFTVITTCSPKNFAMLKDLGAHEAFNYRDPEKCVSDIRHFAGDDIKLVLDCQPIADATQICSQAMSSAGGIYNALLPVQFPRQDVEVQMTHGQLANGEPFCLNGQTIPAVPSAFEEGKKFFALAETLLKEKTIKVPPIEIFHGLEKIPEYIQLLKEGGTTGKRYVCSVLNTS